MKTYSALAFISPILATVVRLPHQPANSHGSYLNRTHPVNLEPRDDITVLCGAPPDYPDSDYPAFDYSYPIGLLLSGRDLKLHVDAGPKKCKQAACNEGGGAGVFLCNDQSNAIDILYTDIGFFAQRVFEKCKHRQDGSDYIQEGQAFNPDNWNVILTDVGSICTASSLPGFP
ncbi:hypothetical protein F4804DRAFT_337081 [Jackrogersella minutella]|nr:hypothetical protein F4804DRAFT_337081 [Jackrogersella minutella]